MSRIRLRREHDLTPDAVRQKVERIAVTGLTALPGGGAHVAVQPDGPFVVVSGRAAAGDFEAAVRDTMEQLRSDLQGVGLAFGLTVARLKKKNIENTSSHGEIEVSDAAMPAKMRTVKRKPSAKRSRIGARFNA
jgi:hypothetical protein